MATNKSLVHQALPNFLKKSYLSEKSLETENGVLLEATINDLMKSLNNREPSIFLLQNFLLYKI